MRLVGYRTFGGVRVAALNGNGKAADLASVDQFWAAPARWAGTAHGPPADLAVGQLDLAPPVRPAARVIGVGLNYRAHAAEGGFELPEYPTVFARWTPSLSVSGTPVPVPAGEPGLDWEGELAVVIGTPLREASETEARAGFLGYAVFNDLSARRAQRRGTQWTLGKNADASGPLGPIVTADEVPGIDAGLHLVTRVNGEIVQDTSTADMIFSPAQVASYLSRTFTLLPGDIICTGTPSGVGHARRPEWFLTPGDVVSVEIEGLGEVTNPVVARARLPQTAR
jgi:2-keto-4-pentenoate hydratase/2-oxohepta-3-ene-1,7-dioic acid hydratase in catechol pathway